MGDVALVGDLVSPDRLFGGPGNDTLTGGDGRDRIHGGPGNDVATGNAGDDLLSGGAGDDQLYGKAGNDRIFANGGNDEEWGGDGNDQLWALARVDVTGPGDPSGDTLHGEAGDDVLHARDGEVDRIDCGPGNDTALLDAVDVIVDATPANPNGSCEKVVRRAPSPKDARQEGAADTPAPAEPGD